MTRARAGLALVVVLAVAARLPFVRAPLGADEGGFLLVASQWAPGSSLYGDYWVDRPPLLIDVFAVADLLGGADALRVVGIVLVVVTVLLAAAVGRVAGGSPLACAVCAAAFLSTPLFGMPEVNGELVAMPFVLGGVVALLRAARPGAARRTAWLLAAGALGAGAALVKQNMVDVAVLAAVGGLTFLRGRGQPPPWRTWATVGLGAAIATGAVLAQAAALGTGPGELWDAVVTFRLDAARVIRASSPDTVDVRLYGVLLALVLSGAPLVLLGLARWPRRPDTGIDLRGATLVLLAWEAVSIAGGGSFWLHYLVCLVPGLVLTTALLSTQVRAPAPRVLRWPVGVAGLAVAVVSTCVAWAVLVARPEVADLRTAPVVSWLREHARPGDTATIAFGRPDYLADTGLHSPYAQLWSLPVRVRDSHLRDFSRVLASSRRPTWIVTDGAGTLAGWGIDDSEAEPLLQRYYRRVADLGDRQVFEVRSRDQAVSSGAGRPGDGGGAAR